MKTKKQMATEIANLAMVKSEKLQIVTQKITKMLLPNLKERYNEIMKNGGTPKMAEYFIKCLIY